MPFRDPFTGSIIPVPNRKAVHHTGPTTRIGFQPIRGELPELDTLGLRVILAPIDGVTPRSLFKDGPFVFQCPPLDAFLEEFAYNHGDFMTAFAGERSRPGGRQLETISFDTIWLDDGSKNHAPDWAIVKKAEDPLAAKERLKALLYSGSPCWLMAHQMPVWHKYDLRMRVTLRSFTSQEKEGELDSRYFSIQVREWRDSTVEQATIGASAPHGDAQRAWAGSSLTVATLADKDDTLYGLAKDYYGSVTMWQSIAKANGITGLGPSESLKNFFRHDPSRKIKLIPRPK